MALRLDATLCEKVIRLSATYPLNIRSELNVEGKKSAFIITISYKEEHHNERLLEIDTIAKEITFFTRPRCYGTETGCIDLADYLRKKDYELLGVTQFLEKRRFKPNEYSLS